MLTEFTGRTAAVTGAASGIGLGIARRCRDRGMNVVMLDVEERALREAAAGVGDDAVVLALQADVSDPDGMEQVAAAAYERFGAVHLLVNNAGVSLTGPLWKMTPKDWSWGVGVNLIGVANGIRSFGSRMIESGEEGHIVSTSSLAGLTPMPHAGVYSATKAAVVALSEVLYHDLRAIDSKVGVSVLCPGLVNTNILKSTRNRPYDASETADTPVPDEHLEFFKLGDTPEDVADRVLHAVENDDFYILTGEGGRPDIAARSQALVELGHPAKPNPGAIMPDSFGSKG
jgi:NAD(P)-dependent dehydrogenase (short-subunit alcohol dehydrogenase family)